MKLLMYFILYFQDLIIPFQNKVENNSITTSNFDSLFNKLKTDIFEKSKKLQGSDDNVLLFI